MSETGPSDIYSRREGGGAQGKEQPGDSLRILAIMSVLARSSNTTKHWIDGWMHVEGVQEGGGGRVVPPTRKVLCESWVAESCDAIVRAPTTFRAPSQGSRTGCRSHEERSVTRCLHAWAVRKDQSVGGRSTVRSGRNTWEKDQKRGRFPRDQPGRAGESLLGWRLSHSLGAA
jgi:hypothetical protein